MPSITGVRQTFPGQREALGHLTRCQKGNGTKAALGNPGSSKTSYVKFATYVVRLLREQIWNAACEANFRRFRRWFLSHPAIVTSGYALLGEGSGRGFTLSPEKGSIL